MCRRNAPEYSEASHADAEWLLLLHATLPRLRRGAIRSLKRAAKFFLRYIYIFVMLRQFGFAVKRH